MITSNFTLLCFKLPTEIILEFRRAIESGRWNDGRELTVKQKEICSQVLLIRGSELIN